MKTLAAIKNELFKDYLKIVSTDNLEQTLDNPLVPVPFTCVSSVENQNAEALVLEINKFFEHKKIKNKDFLSLDENETQQLMFLFNLIQVSTTGVSHSAPVASHVAAQPKVVESSPVVEQKQPEVQLVVEIATVQEAPVATTVAKESFAETVEVLEESTPFDDPESSSSGEEIIEELGIPKNSIIHLIKDEKITAKIVDEKHIDFEGEILGVTEGTKKAFKKAGVTGMALGLANWNYNGQNLKSLKDNK